jgi:hypothetical protein
MAINWWRGIQRLYALVSIVWLICVAGIAWASWSEVSAPLRDQALLGSLSGCIPKTSLDDQGNEYQHPNARELFADAQYSALSQEEKRAVLERVCAKGAEIYPSLSPWGRERILRGEGIVARFPPEASRVSPGAREVLMRLLAIVGMGIIPPLLLYAALRAGRWTLHGFRA